MKTFSWSLILSNGESYLMREKVLSLSIISFEVQLVAGFTTDICLSFRDCALKLKHWTDFDEIKNVCIVEAISYFFDNLKCGSNCYKTNIKNSDLYRIPLNN